MADGNGSLTARYLRGELQRRGAARRGARWIRRRMLRVPGRARAQPQEHRRRDSAGHDGGDHGRFRLGQIDAGARRDLSARSKRCTRRGSAEDEPRAGADRGARSAGGRGWPAARWKARSASRQAVMIDQSPIGRTPRSNPVTYIKAFDMIRALFASTREAEKRGYTAGPFFLQHPRRALRNLPGRWHRDGGDAVPGRRGADLRRVQGHALQERHPGDPLQRAEHSRSAAAHGARGDVVLPRRAAAGAAAEGAGRCGARLPAAGPIGHHAFRRRSAARETGGAPGAGDAAQARCSSSTSPPPACTSTTSPSCWRPSSG